MQIKCHLVLNRMCVHSLIAFDATKKKVKLKVSPKVTQPKVTEPGLESNKSDSKLPHI